MAINPFHKIKGKTSGNFFMKRRKVNSSGGVLPPAMTNFLLLADGNSMLLLADGSSKLRIIGN